MVRVLAGVLVLVMSVTGCARSMRTPALLVGTAITIGGAVLINNASNRSCGSEENLTGAPDLDCAGETLGGAVLGMIVAGAGAGVIIGGMLSGLGDDDPPKPAPPRQPLPVADAPPADPANPPPAMEPEPAQW